MDNRAQMVRSPIAGMPDLYLRSLNLTGAPLDTERQNRVAVSLGTDLETGAITVKLTLMDDLSSLPPGVAAHNSAIALSPLFVAPAVKGGRGPFHSPISAQKLLGQSALLNVMHTLLDESSCASSSAMAPRPTLGERFKALVGRDAGQPELSALNEAAQHWQKGELAATLNTLAGNDVVYRGLSEAYLRRATGLQIQQLSRGKLVLEHESDHQAMSDALTEILGMQPVQGACLWNYMHTKGPSQPNFLITVVKLNGVPVWRWFSASGNRDLRIDEETGSIKFWLTNKKGNKGVYPVKVPSLPSSTDDQLCNVQANMNLLAPSEGSPVRYVGYPDLLVGKKEEVREARLLPRTFTLDGKGELHERSRDTEYAVMSAMALILKTYPPKQDDQLDIAMFSKLPMCSSCQNAVSAALTLPQFSSVTGFRIFS